MYVTQTNIVCLQQLCVTMPLSSLQSSQSGSAQRAPARGGALSWTKPNLQDADVTICVKPTSAAAPTSTCSASKQVSLMSQSLLLVSHLFTCYPPTWMLDITSMISHNSLGTSQANGQETSDYVLFDLP